MAKIYSRVTKINNVVGRSDYISNPDRQEFLKLTGKSRDFEWKEYADFESRKNKHIDFSKFDWSLKPDDKVKK